MKTKTNLENNSSLNYSSKREENESYEDYKERRKRTNEIMRRRLKGFLFWNSSKRGTYKKEYYENIQDNQVDTEETS